MYCVYIYKYPPRMDMDTHMRSLSGAESSGSTSPSPCPHIGLVWMYYVVSIHASVNCGSYLVLYLHTSPPCTYLPASHATYVLDDGCADAYGY